ncbi:MAG: hypothetical protein IPJ68_02700 [Candidatus Moraniibacteriota bacterium]|nr:MAG: hypothetical protein IPJ68_02700 [Candidatus Moranbacteria bacterium]
MKKISIFLSGSVKKGAGDNRTAEYFWSEEDERVLKDALAAMEVEMLNPNTIDIPEYRAKERFDADVDMLLRSDVIIVDARTKKGLGVGAEMVMAKRAGIPVLTLCPYGSEYRGWVEAEGGQRKEWVHPFVSELSDQIFENLDDLAEWINGNQNPKIKL